MGLLVHKEYDIAFSIIEKALLERRKTNSRDIVISGHPGILHYSDKCSYTNPGKTCFLFYLLLRSLSSGWPTALQIRSTYYLFEGTGALVDSNNDVTTPCKTFLWSCKARTTYVVQTTSPNVDRWKSWRKHSNANLYSMDCLPVIQCSISPSKTSRAITKNGVLLRIA
ncbi:hypothetical protein B0F90DRAFT_1778853 [Multifurca ochricompacta]|uniref:Uncharacterized protein n=1 Tax=Multifurca ochricompacta TaxID=376703 RepID=A0AAD4LWR2_9AGAM|nr:hypothetical protein B0F90DRAFT_1778853 [Multifurca ochricompacta]